MRRLLAVFFCVALAGCSSVGQYVSRAGEFRVVPTGRNVTGGVVYLTYNVEAPFGTEVLVWGERGGEPVGDVRVGSSPRGVSVVLDARMDKDISIMLRRGSVRSIQSFPRPSGATSVSQLLDASLEEEAVSPVGKMVRLASFRTGSGTINYWAIAREPLD